MRAFNTDRNYGCRIKSELTYKGYPMVIMENEYFRISILTGKGTDMIELLYKPTDTDYCWFTHLGLREKQAIFADFQHQYEGGWQEILPNLAAQHLHHGVKLEAYGEVSLTEWGCSIVKDEPDEIIVKFINRLRTMPLYVEKLISMKTNQCGFRIVETVFNDSPANVYADWGHHITFGSPYLQPGMSIDFLEGEEKFVLPKPRSPGGFEVKKSEIGRYRILNPTGVGAEVSWDVEQWPYLWFWRDFGESTEAPYYGNHYNVGLEMFSSPPAATLQENIDKGTALQFSPFSSRKAFLEFSVLLGTV